MQRARDKVEILAKAALVQAQVLVGDRGGRKEGGSSGKEVVTRRTLSLALSLSLSVSFCLTHAILSFFLPVLDLLILREREGGEVYLRLLISFS